MTLTEMLEILPEERSNAERLVFWEERTQLLTAVRKIQGTNSFCVTGNNEVKLLLLYFISCTAFRGLHMHPHDVHTQRKTDDQRADIYVRQSPKICM